MFKFRWLLTNVIYFLFYLVFQDVKKGIHVVVIITEQGVKVFDEKEKVKFLTIFLSQKDLSERLIDYSFVVNQCKFGHCCYFLERMIVKLCFGKKGFG